MIPELYPTWKSRSTELELQKTVVTQAKYYMQDLFGRKVAIDASSESNITCTLPPYIAEKLISIQVSMYQFLIAVRQQDGQQLQTDTGETTSYVHVERSCSLLVYKC